MVNTPDTLSGKTFPEHSPVTKAGTSLPYSKPSRKLPTPIVHVPEPEKRGGGKLAWRYSGEMVGDGWSIAWRTVDAQYWGVPQRRRRIYLVTDLGSERAGEILFECESVSWNHEPSGEQRKDATADVGRSTDGRHKNAPPKISGGFVGRQGAKSGSVGFEEEISPTLRQGITADVVHDICLLDSCGGQAERAWLGQVCSTLKATHYKTPPIATIYAIEGNTIDRNSNKNGSGVCTDVSPTMNTQDRHGIAYCALENNECR